MVIGLLDFFRTHRLGFVYDMVQIQEVFFNMYYAGFVHPNFMSKKLVILLLFDYASSKQESPLFFQISRTSIIVVDAGAILIVMS
ncbi:hypothetical protein L484_013657 [Morus notabilis]|uniref:Uncharacterized protein n=1 Tax=Morus notabilis TaxID=981085 RepID=W9QMB1_9ROSA|nr:hypothetical protein L484_013657 [Morus notabilis]